MCSTVVIGWQGRPFTFIDAHAGGGLYNLECDESQVFRNHEGGIAQVIDGVRDKTISDTVYRLMYAAMARLNIALGSHGFQHYLGSTAWALQWLRCQDQVWPMRKILHLCDEDC